MPTTRSLDQISEVHIAPLGYEYDRIVEPVLEYDADLLYLLYGTDTSNPEYHEALQQELLNAGIDIRTRDLNLHDIYDVLGTVTTITDHHREDIVRVNVSSGPKLATVGVALACMATDAAGYHVHPETRNHASTSSPRTEGMVAAEQLPSYPLETPSEDQVRVLNFIDERNTSTYTPKKSDLITFAEDAELNFIRKRQPGNEKAKFALLNNQIIEPLADNGYLQVESVGRTKQISLTDTGKNALRAFRHKLPEKPDR